jgi:hypothetical protein
MELVWGFIEFLLLPAECRHRWRTKGINAMNEITINQTEEEILAFEISDEALETAAGDEKAGNWTVVCTGIQCPG